MGGGRLEAPLAASRGSRWLDVSHGQQGSHDDADSSIMGKAPSASPPPDTIHPAVSTQSEPSFACQFTKMPRALDNSHDRPLISTCCCQVTKDNLVCIFERTTLIVRPVIWSLDSGLIGLAKGKDRATNTAYYYCGLKASPRKTTTDIDATRSFQPVHT
jgi:hypothetical protein